MSGPSSTIYIYTADFAVAFGEGPCEISRIWGDSKLIYKKQVTPGNFIPLGELPAWNPSVSYNTDDYVIYPALAPGVPSLPYQAVLPNKNIIPQGANLYWQVSSEYPPWQSGIVYQPGSAVDYFGQVYVANTTNPGGSPAGNPNWVPLAQYYGAPQIYPGAELQLPDPDIQAAEGITNTPAFRGLCYAKWTKFPLANFGNRIPNIRAQLKSSRTNNLLA